MRLAIIYHIKNYNFEKYYKKIVKETYTKFGEPEIFKSKLSPHITLKFPFETDKIKEIEKIIKDISDNYEKFKLNIGKFGHFTNRVVFAKPRYSQKLIRLQKNLMKKLKVPLQFYDKEWVPHTTISFCKNDKNYRKIWKFIKQKRENEFEIDFDNICILRKYSRKDWKIYKEFKLK